MNVERTTFRRHLLKLLGAVACSIGLPLSAGCGDAQSRGVAEVRRKVLAGELPERVLSLAEAHAMFEERKQMAVVGRIFSSLGSPFDPDTTAFNLIELPKPGHSHDDPGDCPFCKRDMENAASALVQVVNAAGEVLKSSAEKLLGLSKNQDVVVEGTATKVGEILLFRTSSLHVLSPEKALEFAKRIHG